MIVRISPEGKVSIEKVGFKGKECAGKADEILKALGGEVTTQKKPEWHQGENAHVTGF